MKGHYPIKEWLDAIPSSKHRKLALANYDKQYSDDCNNEASSMTSALYNAFEWYDSDEGEDYWQAFYDYLRFNGSVVNMKSPTEIIVESFPIY